MSDCVAGTKGRAIPRLTLAGLGLLFLSGCSSDVTRFNQSDSPFSNPFASKTTRRADARRDDFAARASRARRVWDTHRFALEAAGGGWIGRGLDRRRRLADRRRQWRDAGHDLGPLRRAGLRASRRQRPFERLRGEERDAPCGARLSRRRARRRQRRQGEGGKKHDADVADADVSKSKKAKDKEKEKAAKADKAAKEAEKSASKDAKESKGAAVAEAEPPKSSEAKKPAIDKTPTGNLESGASQSKIPLTGAQADAAGTEPEFRWPARGRIIQGFKSGGNDGINISVPAGTSVRAAESGTVVYSGDGLKGYGNLVLIKHPNGFVTAYGNNGELDVKRGETVKRGQVIAKSGDTGNVNSPQLHFELRKGSTPVDPTSYLAGL